MGPVSSLAARRKPNAIAVRVGLTAPVVGKTAAPATCRLRVPNTLRFLIAAGFQWQVTGALPGICHPLARLAKMEQNYQNADCEVRF
jgi:hypothetical protein